MNVGDRVTITDACSVPRYRGEQGTVTVVTHPQPGAMVQLDSEAGRPRFFNLTSLRLEKLTMTIKSSVTDAIKNLLPRIGDGKDALVKELLVSTAAASAADSRKKKAKAAVLDAGIVLPEYRPGDVEAYRSDFFVLNTKTKEPTSRLDQPTLIENLRAAGLSQAKITKAINDATFENKPATSYEVIER